VQTYLLDWLNLVLRWGHVIFAIAWVGSSFYFVFLDSSLTEPADPELRGRGVSGELWAVHGGGFYHPTKYAVAPRTLPQHLHWFFWESYSTWLSGFALFTLMYLLQPASFLVDPRVHAFTPGGAAAAALGFLVGFWLLYDGLCRWLGERPNADRLLGVLVAAVVALAAWAACSLFAGRAAFLLVGAMMATAMSANVFFWIIPGQRTVVAQLRAGQVPDPVHGRRGKQRSVHNTYFTLPVVFAMLSNHYGWLTQSPHNAVALVLLMAAAALVRQFFVARHKARVEGRRWPWGYFVAGVVLWLAVVAWLAPRQAPVAAAAAAGAVGYAQVRPVFEQRCVPCHNAQLANKGVRLDAPEQVAAHVQQVLQQAVLQKTMPLNNATQMTDDERRLLQRWIEGGAPLK
jgi:uncharacterized membrane protein